MKKIAIVLFVVSAALAGCGKKKAPAAPAGGDTAGSAEPAMDGSAAPAEETPATAPEEGSDAAPAEGGAM
jgi:hypothetical protein